MSVIVNGVQVDFQAALVINNGIQSYQHVYVVRDSGGGDDQFQIFNLNNNPCLANNNPCKNGGTCYNGYNKTFSCNCPTQYTGKCIS